MNAAPRRATWQNGVWFRLNVGRERNADPKWLLPEICRQGELTKKDIGAIRVFEMETLFQVAAEAAPKFATLVSERKKGGVRISPALDQSGESTARPRDGARWMRPATRRSKKARLWQATQRQSGQEKILAQEIPIICWKRHSFLLTPEATRIPAVES